ncbi:MULTISPECIES: Rieske 2Fe-2S domain-containing protein [Pseudoalteromonas]|uniref:Rieske domain-containing protein n=1 Tax=Pseudoalteromonas amylolytica TaxID=1859457 RepID=A0A1S1MX45_9GAMM|nr:MULTISPECIES: Rieske 2Fe-2S domain-containing protein [Pseudoalteromonas]OHU88008.1 hypothetical protein BFC16_11465 [Pseudoalteromonas sp. JW3]OHU91448.1 hypothetical protein BET10_11585 [Pseudoalteromonas amylolytica]
MLKEIYNKIVNAYLVHYSKGIHRKYAYDNAPQIKERYPNVPFFLNGWQAVCMESELKNGQIISKNLMGENIVIWKSTKGEVAVTSAYCSHFGIHLGAGGKVVGDHLRCAFHHRCFDKNGVAKGKKEKPIKPYVIDINAGIVFVWFHSENESPTWNLPRLDTDYMGNKWEIEHQCLKGVNVKAHPIDFIENGVDFNHAIKLHGLCHQHTKLFEQDEKLSVRLKRGNEDKGNININAYGPFVIDYNIDFYWRWHVYHRFLVLLQLEADGSFTAHRIKMKRHAFKANLQEKLFNKGVYIFNEIKVFKTFMQEDHMIMMNRKHLEFPDLEKDDLYTRKFRLWYKQFYPSQKNIYSAHVIARKKVA